MIENRYASEVESSVANVKTEAGKVGYLARRLGGLNGVFDNE